MKDYSLAGYVDWYIENKCSWKWLQRLKMRGVDPAHYYSKRLKDEWERNIKPYHLGQDWII